jgi:hypothetical protein
MPSLAAVIAFEAMYKASERRPVAHRRSDLLRRKGVLFWSTIRPLRATTPAGLRVASPATAPMPVRRLRPAH